MAKAEKLLRIRITNASADFMLHVRITNDHWMQTSLTEPFISQDSEKLRFQKSRKPQATNVFSRSAGFFAPHQRAAPFRREESLRQFIHVCVFLPVIFQFVLIRLISEMPSTLSRLYLKRH